MPFNLVSWQFLKFDFISLNTSEESQSWEHTPHVMGMLEENGGRNNHLTNDTLEIAERLWVVKRSCSMKTYLTKMHTK